MNVIYQIAQADFLERIRRSSFLMTIFLTVVLAYIFSPPRDGNYVTLIFDHYVGIYNSAWMGTSVAISVSVFFTLIGYYLISNAIDVDNQTKVSQIIAASAVSKTNYILGKYFSNFSILSVIILITMITAMMMQLIRGEDLHLDLWAFVSPFLFLVVPLIALLAAVAIWFEVIPWFRGTLGNVLYFILWMVSIFPLMGMEPIHIGKVLTVTDPFGQIVPLTSIDATVRAQFPDYNGQFSNGLTALDEPVETFVWNGVDWSFPLIAGRFLWILVALVFVWIASLFFHRFDQDKNTSIEEKKAESKITPAAVEPMRSATSLTPVNRRFTFLPVLMAEFKVMLLGHRWWYLVATILIILGFTLPFDVVQGFVLPLAWIWPLSLWSRMGSREKRFRTEELLSSIPNSSRRLLPASWLAGVILSVLMSAGVAVRLLAEGEMMMLSVWLIGALFVPSLALVCGVWSNSSKMFEIVYLIIWYLGPLNDITVLNFMDLHAWQNAMLYGVMTMVLYGIAVVIRKRKWSGK